MICLNRISCYYFGKFCIVDLSIGSKYTDFLYNNHHHRYLKSNMKIH